MREIKFRAWEKKPHTSNPDYKQEMQYDVQHCTFCDGGECFDRFLSDDWVLMQFTGLLDRNGKEIYEGDIFKHTTHDSIEVVAWDDYYGGYKMPNSFDEECMYYLGDIDGIEVIGNIWENPDLLTKK